jgi:hypothetical protein
MLRLGEGDARGRLKERDGQPLIESVTYRKILCLCHGAITGNGVRTKLTGDKAHEKEKVKKLKALKPRPGRHKKVQDSGFERNKNAHELDRGPIDLPDSYGETRAVLMAIEPYLLHVYWEVTSDELEKAKHWFDDDHAQCQTILRFYDVTNAIVDNEKTHSFFDMDIDLYSSSRYVHLWSPDKSYFVELGFKAADGRFFPLVRSNVAKTPSAWPAPKADQRDAAVHGNPEEGLSKALIHEDHCVDPTIKTGNTEEQVKLQKEQKSRHRGEIAQDMDSAQTLPTKLVGGREFETRRKPSFQPAPSLKEKVQGQSEKGVDVDITEMSEQAFALGVSSERGASPQKKKDSADS